MNLRKQLIFPIFIGLGMSMLAACGNNNQNDMQTDDDATGTYPEGDNTMTDTTDTYLDTMQSDSLEQDTFQ